MMYSLTPKKAHTVFKNWEWNGETWLDSHEKISKILSSYHLLGCWIAYGPPQMGCLIAYGSPVPIILLVIRREKLHVNLGIASGTWQYHLDPISFTLPSLKFSLILQFSSPSSPTIHLLALMECSGVTTAHATLLPVCKSELSVTVAQFSRFPIGLGFRIRISGLVPGGN